MLLNARQKWLLRVACKEQNPYAQAELTYQALAPSKKKEASS